MKTLAIIRQRDRSKCLFRIYIPIRAILPAQKLGIDTFRLKMSTEIYEYEENTIPPLDLIQKKEVAEYVAVRYNSPFAAIGAK